MGRFFDDVVEQAVEDIYYCYDKKKAAAAMEALKRAAGAGNADAAYVLSRCYCGPEYSWEYHPFLEDNSKVEYWIRYSILNGSAMGVLGAMRCGMLTPQLERDMPFADLKEVWDIVFKKAQGGCAFCQNMIGNTYYWLDIVKIDRKSPGDFQDSVAWNCYLKEMKLACIPWFERAFRGGMGFAGRNLYNLYGTGENGMLERQLQKADEVRQLGAQLGYPEWLEMQGKHLLKQEGRETEGFRLCKHAADKGQLSAWYPVGKAYREGKIVPKDVPYALSCFEKGLDDPQSIGCANMAGELYFLGKDGVPQDYGRAVRLLERAYGLNSTWGSDMLGLCYLMGWGCLKDTARARMLLENFQYNTEFRNFGLGLIYADGIEGPQDIRKGVEYLMKAKTYEPANQALLRFKKTVFGKWVRR